MPQKSPAHSTNSSKQISERPQPQVVQAMEILWLSPEMQQAYQRRNEFQLADSAAYFLSNVSKFTSDNYVPSDQDILRTRVTTTGIVKVQYCVFVG